MADGDEWAGLDPGDEWPETGHPEVDAKLRQLARRVEDSDASVAGYIETVSVTTVAIIEAVRNLRAAGQTLEGSRMLLLDLADDHVDGQPEPIRRAIEAHIIRVAAATRAGDA